MAEQTGLSRPTVDAVLTALAESGPVRVVAAAPSTAPGRPARRFTFAPEAATVAAVDIGDRSVRCLLTDAAGRMVATGRREYAGNGAAARLDAVAQVVQDAADEGGTDERLSPAVVGIAVPGILDADGRLAQSLAVKDLEGTDISSELSLRLGCPVAVENDIKLAAYAEHHLSARPADIAFVQIGHRISVALILGGRILQGRHRLAGELGTQRGMRWTSTSRRGRLHWSTAPPSFPGRSYCRPLPLTAPSDPLLSDPLHSDLLPGPSGLSREPLGPGSTRVRLRRLRRKVRAHEQPLPRQPVPSAASGRCAAGRRAAVGCAAVG